MYAQPRLDALGRWAVLGTFFVASALIASADAKTHRSEVQDFVVKTLTTGFEHPWSVAFLPDGGYLVTEREGRLRYVDPTGALDPRPIAGLPGIEARGQGGLLDVVLHPGFERNRRVYLSYVARGPGGYGTHVARGILTSKRLDDVEVLFRAEPMTTGGRHFGSRLVFDRSGQLHISLGDRGDRPRAQDLSDHAGSMIRLEADGRVPADNPFRNRAGARPEIASYGHRNIQGLALDPASGELWAHEHGPQGGDEVNRLQLGANYGWPIVTFGRNYFIGTPIGEGHHKPGMVDPVHQWTPSIAPSGMTFYTGEHFANWRGNLFVGALKFQLLVRLVIEGEAVRHEERLLEGELGRIRDVRQGPDGYLYLLTDAANGALVRLEPAP